MMGLSLPAASLERLAQAHLFLWCLSGAMFAVALLVAAFNGMWAVMGLLASRRGERGPSLVPVIAPMFGCFAFLLAPTPRAWVLMPIACVIDMGTAWIPIRLCAALLVALRALVQKRRR